jgi:hypothetical protein
MFANGLPSGSTILPLINPFVPCENADKGQLNNKTIKALLYFRNNFPTMRRNLVINYFYLVNKGIFGYAGLIKFEIMMYPLLSQLRISRKQ